MGNGVSGRAEERGRGDALATLGPDECLANRSLGLHAVRSVVEVGELECDLAVEGEEDLLACAELGLGGSGVGGGEGGVGALRLESAVRLVEAVHHREDLVLAELDLNDTLGLEDSGASGLVGVPEENARQRREETAREGRRTSPSCRSC